ncbi:MAG: 23S rRNA (adenine(2030)-N(6))-methyltransferase RlmJ [Methanotrichaceae archaeon]|nr:23S rRNA (adenine(2030)-N(6))-methyltransferase RlmJ [Methanotrichaceae archaeon]
MDSERQYNHSAHAGNAGDVWKHFVLGEVADYIFSKKPRLIYAESHVGYPEYELNKPGEWEGGIGRCWPNLPDLKNFCYFDILSAMNMKGLMRYPGSTSFLIKAAKKRGASLQAELWDTDPQVASAWSGVEHISFHLGDGFKGVRSLLGRSPSGLILIDPPHIDSKNAKLANALLSASKKAGWTVLLWQMAGQEKIIDSNKFEAYSLEFDQAGLDGGRWSGSSVYLACSDQELNSLLEKRIHEFLKIMC